MDITRSVIFYEHDLIQEAGLMVLISFKKYFPMLIKNLRVEKKKNLNK